MPDPTPPAVDEAGPTFFATQADFRAWLEANHATRGHLWVGYHKRATGRPSVTWEQTVEEANEHAVSLGEEVDGTWYPVSVGRQRLRWTGTALEP